MESGVFRIKWAYAPIVILSALTSFGFAKDVPVSPPLPRSILVNVFDAHGLPIRDLTKDNFRVRLNGKPVAVLNARYAVAPRRIVVLLDMSRSMTDDDAKWSIAREAVSDLLAQTPKAVPIAMLTFAQDIRDEFNSPQNRGTMSEWLNGPPRQPILKRGQGGTVLFDAIVEGLNLLGGLQVGDAMYAITDGFENASRKSEEQAERALLQSRVRLFAFVLAQPSDRPLDPELEKRSAFLSLLDETGGRWVGSTAHGNHFGARDTINYLFKEDSREKLKVWTQWLNLQVNEFWTLDLASPKSEKKGNINVEVLGPRGTIRKDVGLTYPRLLPASR